MRVLLATLLLAGTPLAMAAGAPRCDLDALQDRETPDDRLVDCARRIATSPARSAGVGDDLLHQALDALSIGALTHPAAGEPDAARRLMAELEARGIAQAGDRAGLRQVLLANGRLDEAAALPAGKLSMPAREPMGSRAAPGETRVWRWNAQADTMREEAVDLRHGLHLVAYASAAGPYSDEAASAIDGDPAMVRLLRDALWVSRPDYNLDAQYWRRWNAAHPSHPLTVIADAQGWDVDVEWFTPLLRVFRDGKVVASAQWLGAISRPKFMKLAESQGLPTN